MAAELFSEEWEREQLQGLEDAAREPGIDLTRREVPVPALATQREARLYLGIGAAEWSVLSQADRETVVNDYADAFGLRRMRLSWSDCGWEEIPEDAVAQEPPWQLGIPRT